MKLALHPEFVVDQKERKKAVLLPLSEWKTVLEALEDLEDIHAYDKAKSEKDEFTPFEEALKQIRSKNR